ncbi:MAG: DoxX family protein, partial [Deltaproteobacteria bacterium]|nr:DoxX family protein [Deltaproteobacteria bacterium]
MALRFLVAAILLPVGYSKLAAGGMDVMLFERLGMEPQGRIIIGLLEIIAGLLMLSPQAASGALLAVGIMFGAIIAHATVLGVDVGDGGRHVAMLAFVLVSSVLVLYARRRDLPIIGKSF